MMMANRLYQEGDWAAEIFYLPVVFTFQLLHGTLRVSYWFLAKNYLQWFARFFRF